MNNLLKVKSNSSLARDKISKAIINTDISEWQKHIERKKALKSKDDRLANLEKKVLDLEFKLNTLLNR